MESGWANQSLMDKECDEDYPSTQCFIKAMEFLNINKDADNWHLHLEVFDPHEPFDCPKKYRDIYDDDWDRYHYTWPLYGRLDPQIDDEETIMHIRKCYAGTLTMADTWLGKLFDKKVHITGQETDTAYLSNSTKAFQLFGYPQIPLGQMMTWIADWLKKNNPILNKPTHFETRNGKY